MPISDFLIPLFDALTYHYGKNWAVLHSHEGLPHVLKGDLDLVVGETKYSKLETLLKEVANKTDFELCQVLWYDVDRSTTFIFLGGCGEVVNVDFLLDKYGNSRYGFKSRELAENTTEFNGMCILSEQKMLEYRIVKSISKARETRLNEEINEYKIFLEGKLDSSGMVRESHIQFETKLSDLKSFASQLTRKKYSSICYYFSQFHRVVHRVCYPTGLIIFFNQSWKKDLVGLREDFLINQSFRKEENSNRIKFRALLFLLFSGLYTIPSRLLPKGWIIFYSCWFRIHLVRLNSLKELKFEIREFLLKRRLVKL